MFGFEAKHAKTKHIGNVAALLNMLNNIKKLVAHNSAGHCGKCWAKRQNLCRYLLEHIVVIIFDGKFRVCGFPDQQT